MATIEKLNREKGITVLIITHNMDETVRADRVVVIDGGNVKMDGTPREVFAKVNELFALGLAVPQATELAARLELSDIPLTPTEGADAIERWLNS
jgi:energy-coupling factor transport system ATP-binding protein